jgi:quinol monooxygenase YgiN
MTKGRIPMDNRKIYLLAELTVLPEFLDEVKAALAEALIPTLQEPGCEALFETSREDNPHKLIFFEVFSSPEAHKFHLEQDHTKRVFSALEGKLAEATIMTKLNAL